MAVAAATSREQVSLGTRLHRFVDKWLLPVYVAGVTLYLVLPVAVMILFSFNQPPGRSNLQWGEFSLEAWGDPLGRPGLARGRGQQPDHRVRGDDPGDHPRHARSRSPWCATTSADAARTNILIFLPMSTPEIVLGASLLTTFIASVQLPFIPQGVVYPLSITTIILAHIMFNISFVVVTVKARLQGFPRHLEEAAMDLGANEWVTFWRVTFPLILPGIMAAALLAFSLSIDDYVITSFTAGQTQTFPLFIYGSQLRGIPVQVNVIGTMIFVIAVGFVLLTTLWQRRVAARDYRTSTAA